MRMGGRLVMSEVLSGEWSGAFGRESWHWSM